MTPRVASQTDIQASASGKTAFPDLADIRQLADDTPELTDIAAINLICASGLPGAEQLDVEHCLRWIDDAARNVRLQTERNYHQFLDDPAAFDNSQARFCALCLVSVLQHQCGVHYNPVWKAVTPDCRVPDGFGKDACDLFIHAIIDGIGGTCSSLPVLYVAVGRRLGYPLKLVKAARHLFVRWDDPASQHWFQPERFNIEATGPGVHFLPDDHYHNWPHKITEEDIGAGIFLKSLSRREELAEFLAVRGFCLRANGRLHEAVSVLAEASRLAPHNKYLAHSHQSLRLHMVMRRRGHAFLNAPFPGQDQLPDGPFWVTGIGGDRVLIQVLKQASGPLQAPPTLGLSLIRRSMQLPNGQWLEAYLPLHASGFPMTAHWLPLTCGQFALVHKPVTNPFVQRLRWYRHEATHKKDQFKLSEAGPFSPSRADSARPHFVDALKLHEKNHLLCQIQAAARVGGHQPLPDLPQVERLAIPAGPAALGLPDASGSRLFLL